MNPSDRSVTILQAAEFLGVTDKTIRNYIQRGTLDAGKWNGSWRIGRTSLEDVYWKRKGRPIVPGAGQEMAKYGAPTALAPRSGESDAGTRVGDCERIVCDAAAISALQRRSGRLEAAEAEADRQRSECGLSRKRIEQLEASAASAWAELREVRAALGREGSERQTAQQLHAEAVQENSWLRREIGRLMNLCHNLAGQSDEMSAARNEMARSLAETRGEVQELKSRYSELRERYRRDGFLD